MIAFSFTFPAGCYHATPWGRHTNEADVAWPPEPARILRALIATWWRKGDHQRIPKSVLDGLVDALATELPVFVLPPAVHAHIRAFMPAPVERKLIYDGFLRFDRGAELIVAWPAVTLEQGQRDAASYLLESMGYLGRAESWVESRITPDWQGDFNASARASDSSPANDSVPVDAYVPLDPTEWSAQRARHLSELANMPKAQRTRIQRTLPEKLSEALAVDTSDWQKAGWSSPPPLKKIVYDRPMVGSVPPDRSRSRTRAAVREVLGKPEVARYVLAGRPAPSMEQALRIAEIARMALMSLGHGPVPSELSGRDDIGPLRDDPHHRHAFFLPEDANGDGLIDHLVVYCRCGFSSESRRRLDSLTRLWLEHGRADEEGVRGRKEWRVALEAISDPEIFVSASREVSDSTVLGSGAVWQSVTPYLKPRFDKQRPRSFDALVESYRAQIAHEWAQRYPSISAPRIEPLVDPDRPSRFALSLGRAGRLRSTLAFARTRSGRGGRQPDTAGGFFRLSLDRPVAGPIALGWGAHFGLGMFQRV